MVFDDSIHFTSVSMALTLLEEVLFSSMGGEGAACFRRMTEVCANSPSWGSTKPWPSQSFLPAAVELADSEVQASWRLSLFKQRCHDFLIPLLSSCICSPNDSPSLLDLGHFSCSLLLSRCFPRCPWLSPLCVGLLLSYPPLLLTFFFFFKPLTLSGSSLEELHSRGFHYLVSLSSCSLQRALGHRICPNSRWPMFNVPAAQVTSVGTDIRGLFFFKLKSKSMG